MYFKVTGFVLREQSTSESDRIITVLTKQRGVIRAFAKGAKSPRSKKNAGTQLFSFCTFDLYSGNNSYSVEDASPLESFFGLRNDIKKLALAQYFCELMCELAPREDEAEDYLNLLLNACFLLMTDKKEPDFLKPVFEIRLLTLSGYMPDVLACRQCGAFESDTMFFDSRKGELYCDKCCTSQYFIPMSPGAVAAIRHVEYADKGKTFAFSLKGQASSQFKEAAERYLISVTMRNYKTLDFYNMLG